MSDNPLAQITEGLTKPATVLIEKIADATGILYEPKHIVEVAKAQAEAAKIQAEAEIEIAKSKSEVAIIQAESKIEITDRQRRAAQRWLAEQGQQQESIENTIIKAIPQLNEDANPHAIDDDWIAKFFDKSRLVSDDKMQDLWASVLAGEANCAGLYSARALTTLADMDQKVAALFNTFCSLCIVSLEDSIALLKSSSNFKIRDARVPIITGSNTFSGTFQHGSGKFAQKSEAIYQRYGFGINEFQLLLEYGLIQDENTHTVYSSFLYNDDFWGIKKLPSTEGEFQPPRISGYSLSSVGKELFHITKRSNPRGYLESLIDFLKEYYDVKMYRFPKPQPSAQ